MDSRPFAIDQYRLKPEIREALIDPEKMGPLRPTGTGFGAYYNTDFLNEDAFETVKYRQNNRSTNASLAGKIDVNLGSSMNLTFGASGRYSSQEGADYVLGGYNNWNNSLMNYQNHPLSTAGDWRAYGKFTQRFSSSQEEGSEGGVKNAFYTIMVDYSKSYRKLTDPKHGDNFFNYGYVGKFETERVASYSPMMDDNNNVIGIEHDGFNDVEVTFTPSTVNNGLAALTSQYFTLYDDVVDNYENFNQIQDGGGLLNGMNPQNVYNIWSNVGTRYNGFGKIENSQLRVTGQGSADIGDHAVSVGFEWEQRVDRSFTVSPISLWTHMRQLANNHIRELDKSQSTVEWFGSYPRITYERLNAAPGDYSGNDAQAYFDYNLRNELGLDADGVDYIDVDALDPSTFSLGMFSADELLNSGNNFVTYYGFDHKGDKLKSKPSFDQFFLDEDNDGNKTRLIGAFEPIYISGYVMDKFAFDDLIFNVGLRTDVFDANQFVLKDPYSLYLTKTVGEVTEIGGNEVTHPSSLPSDAVVYVNDINDPTAVNGYRVGNTWYNASGQEISDPVEIETSAGIAPLLADGEVPTE